jgi:uncharacterized protein YhdP
MHGTRAEPGVAPGAAGAAAGVPFAPGLRALILAAASAAVLIAAGLLAYALALARVPQHRAALEELIHSQTGLEVRFSELGLGWGWYGPEAVFRGVELAEPGAAGVLLRAPTLLVDFDTWRMLRSGAPAAARITLENPAIDLADGPHFVRAGLSGGARAGATDPGAATQEAALTAGARILSNWRGTRVDIMGGTLRLPAAGGAGSPLELAIRRVSLRRTGARVVADAAVLLPQSLGLAAHARLDLITNPNTAGIPSATLELDAERLDFAGWRTALEPLAPQAQLPVAGSGNLALHVSFDHGRVLSAGGTLAAEGLAWQVVAAHEAGLRIDRLRGAWQLTRTAGGWHLTANPLELSIAIGGPGNMQLAGLVRAASFDFSAHPAAGARLRTAAELDDIKLRTAAGDVALAGLAASIEGEDGRLRAAVSAHDARLRLSRSPAIALGGVQVGAHLALEQGAQGWRLSTRDLRVAAGALALQFAGEVSDVHATGHPRIDAQVSLTGADVGLLRRVLGTAPLAALGAAPGELAAGRIDNADIELRGPLDEPLPWKGAAARFSGSLELHAATLVDPQLWPDIRGLDAQVAWRGENVRVRLTGAEAGTFSLESGAIEWNRRTVHFSGRVAGAAQEALAWLRGHPELRQYAPRLEGLDMRGNTLLDFDIRMPALGTRAPDPQAVHSRFAAVLDGVQLRPVEGLPPISTLRGTLAASDGRLQRSTLTGTWLGGPVALTVSERRTGAAGGLAISGRGLLNVSQALRAAAGDTADLDAMTGTAEWSADFRQLPGAAGGALRWRARLDSSLVGVASRLPEPLAKTAAAALPLHVELTGSEAAGELRLALGERLRAVAALAREGEFWQVARGALSLGPNEPELPTAPAMLLSGRVSRMDLPACVALWRALAHNPGWPSLHAQLTATELTVSGNVYDEVTLTADSAGGADTLRLDSRELSGEARWPVSGGPTKLAIEDLRWQGRSLGRLTAALTVHDGSTFEAADIHLSGASDEGQGALRCEPAACSLKFSLESEDAAATLASFGLRSDVSAAHARLEGELGWQPQGPLPALATAAGKLHIQLEDGATRAAAATEAAPGGVPCALLVVPALIAATGSPQLRFANLSGDFTLRDGQAVTSDLHFDGDAEILVHGRVGLLAHDYDAQLWLLKGEERLPAALRGFEPTPKIAALWLSLRSLIAGQTAERTRGVVHLRGSWDEPVATAGE